MRVFKQAIAFTAILFVLSLILPSNLSAASRRANEVNAGTISIVSGGINGTYIRIAADLATVLDNGEEFRVLPILGQGAVQNITDVLYLRGVDIGIVQSDVMAHLLDSQTHGNLENRVHYITKLYNEELHLVAGPSIKSVTDLEGKKVNIGTLQSGTNLTANLVFKALGVNVVPVEIDQALAIEQLRKGEIAATVFVTGKPAAIVSSLTADDKLHLVPIPYVKDLQETYLPASFDTVDYPNLVADGEFVDTIAVGAVMAVFNWPQGHFRYKKLETFIDRFFSNFDQFLNEARHPKWQEVNLAAELPGWTRFTPAKAWLATHSLEQEDAAIRPDDPQVEAEFASFLKQMNATDTAPTGERRAELFRAFLVWQQQQTQ